MHFFKREPHTFGYLFIEESMHKNILCSAILNVCIFIFIDFYGDIDSKLVHLYIDQCMPRL